MKCRAFASEQALAATLARTLVDTVRRQPQTVFGLPTGRTPLLLYEEIARLTAAEQIDWSEVRTFNLDEFVGLNYQDARSYRRFMHAKLFDRLNLRPEHIDFLDGRAADAAQECARYERAIAAAGGLDVLVLGIGANGHIGFNEPADALQAATHTATLDEPTRAANAWWFDGDLSRVPREALTMGMGTILRARMIVLMATGASKLEAVRAMLQGPVTPRVPASFLQLHPRVDVMLDELLADQLA